MKAFLIGNTPNMPLGCDYVNQPPFDLVVIGSLSLGQLLHFREEAALSALAEGKPVLLYEPGLPDCGKNRSLAAVLAARKRELKSWGIRFTDGGGKRLITAQQARAMVQSGQMPMGGAVLTPLAKEILEGLQ